MKEHGFIKVFLTEVYIFGNVESGQNGHYKIGGLND
jgi:hypothetical protein